jgi:hypothetical protein
MNLDELIKQLNILYGFDITQRVRQRQYSYARKVYCKLAKEVGHTLQLLGSKVGISHDCAIYHVRTFDTITHRDKVIFNKIVKKNRLNVKLCKMPTKKKVVKQTKLKPQNKELIKEITQVLSKWETESLMQFISTRLMPYDKLIKATKLQIQPPEIKGAKLKRQVKNPVLC